MALLVADVTFDMAQVLWRLVFVLSRYLGSIDPGRWMASMASPTTAFVFFGSLGLKLISGGGGIVGLSFVFVLGGIIARLSVGVLVVFLC